MIKAMSEFSPLKIKSHPNFPQKDRHHVKKPERSLAERIAEFDRLGAPVPPGLRLKAQKEEDRKVATGDVASGESSLLTPSTPRGLPVRRPPVPIRRTDPEKPK